MSANQVSQADIERAGPGGWSGSDVTQSEIEWLYRTRRIPAGVECRRHSEGLEPNPGAGEYVVFSSHFERGFGLPASPFFWDFLDKFLLQPHHLPANAITVLSAFVAFCEGYLGLRPTIEIFAKYFQFRKQSIPNPENKELPKDMTPCGAATIIPRKGSIFPRIGVLDSCRKWQRTFFYVKNTTDADRINLPAFQIGAPTEQQDWDYKPVAGTELSMVHQCLEDFLKEGLTPDDLLRTFISRRVCPLQDRVHKICHMGGLQDPTRVSPFPLSNAEIRRRVKAIAKTSMTDKWVWGKKPHDRNNLPEHVSVCCLFRHILLPR